jgi:hypothetical protein
VTFDSELRDCLAVVLGSEPPAPDYEARLFFKQWLAERNLGLVPIANPADFAWPGHWIACVRAADGDHAVVMFGSPSGPLHDPGGALAGGGTIEEGWLVARLDVHLPIDAPSTRDRRTGSVAGIFTARRRSAAGARRPGRRSGRTRARRRQVLRRAGDV